MKKLSMILVALLLFVSGCGSNPTDIQTSANNSNSANSSKEVYIMAGKVESQAEANISSKLSARVLKVMVDVGSKVTKGQPLLYLDTQDIAAQVKQAEAGASAAQANLDKVMNGARPEVVAQAQDALNGAKTNYNNAKSNLQRMQTLYQQGGVSIQQLETTKGQYASAEAAYKTAQEQLNVLKRGETKDTINAVRSQVTQAEAAVDVARTQLNNGVLVSPISGTISHRNINVGELASPSIQLFTIVSNDKVYINAQVPSEYLGQLKVGQKVVAKVAELPDKIFEGEISVISPVIDNHSNTVKVILNNEDMLLKPGMIAEIGIKK